jgi:hypothetical protein
VRVRLSKLLTPRPGEYLGCDFGIALTVTADEQARHLHSDHHFLAAGAV